MTTRRLDFVEGLRGVAVGAVLIYHSGLWAGIGGQAGTALSFGRVGVDLFFVLSGLCMVWPLLNPDGSFARLRPVGFLVRRFRRIAPPYYLALLCALVVSFGMWKIGAPAWPVQAQHVAFPATAAGLSGNLLAHLTFTHGLSQHYTLGLDGSFWSLSTEWQFYVLLPALLIVARRWGVATLAVGCAVTTMAYIGALHFVRPGWVETNVGTALILFRIVEFAAGIAVAWLVRHRRVTARWTVPALAAMVVAGVAQHLGPYTLYPFVWSAACGLLVLACSAPGTLHRIVVSRPVRALGRISYSAYLIHGSVYFALVIPLSAWHAGFAVRVAVLMVLGPVLAVGAAHWLHRLVEKPAVAWSHRVPARRAELVPVAGPAA